MRPQFAHRHNTAFARSSSLGEVHAQPVIQKVTVQRGNGAKHLIVKNGVINKQKFGYRKHDKITFEARLIGAGFFYATSLYDGRQCLLFVTKANNVVSYTIEQDIPLVNLNFHISPTIPSNLDPSFVDSASRKLLRQNPAMYNNLGFMPTEPSIDDSSSNWTGDISDHKWSYGRSGSDVSKGENIRLWQNYDAGWLAGSAMYRYMGPGQGWECVQQNVGFLQVGQPHCIVGQMYGYKDTGGYGGEYHYFSHHNDDGGMFGTDLRFTNAKDGFDGDHIRIIEQGGANMTVRTGSKWYGKNKHSIQSKGGKHKYNYDGGPYWNMDDEDVDKFCAKVEWWNPNTNTWSKPQIHPDYNAKVTAKGRFAFYFRFPRQLNTDDEYYDITPQWQLGKTWDAYPRRDSDSGSETFNDVIYSRIGRPNVSGTDSGIQVTTPDGQKMRTSKTSPTYYIMMAPAEKSDDGDPLQKRRYIRTSGDVVYQAVDPFAYSYSDNPDILSAYWVNGNFKPGGAFMLLGQATDFFPGYWISTTSLAKKNNTPMDLRAQQYDLTRGSHQPNEFTGDKIDHTQIKTFKVTDIDNPSKVANFQPSWDACFPGVPLTKEILIAIIRGDQLPALDEIENTKLAGFLEDDPLKYEVDYEGVKFRHSYSLVYCKIPEGWWGPTVTTDANSIKEVYLGGQNHYYYIKEEKINLADEIEAQIAKEAAGATAAEAFADSELEEPMVDITFEAYKNRNEVIKENINKEPDNEKSWFFRTEMVKFRHKKFSLLGSVGDITDVTDRYSADQVTSLDGLSSKNTQQYGFNELFVVEGLEGTPSLVLTPPKEPEGGVPVKHSNVSGFGNIDRHALKSRALGNGNPMRYSTEEKQDSIQVAPMGGVLDTALGFDDGTIKDTVTTGAYVLGGLVALGAIIKLKPMFDNMATAAALKKTAKNRLLESEIDTITALKKAKKSKA
ncbi:MAG: hypothetical protein CMH30_04905 [Micavibrio sp.]|nr:hypothetical protein [Micavibrio sp.]